MFRNGFGYVFIEKRNAFYSWGWSVHLPGYFGFSSFGQDGKTNRLVQMLELMSHFPTAKCSDWYRNGMTHLEGFRTESGRYRFPRHYPHEDEGYYVSGYHMGLGEPRRKKISLEIESTFRMLRLKKNWDK